MGWPDGWTDLALREPVPVPTGWGEDWEGDVPRTVTGVPHRTSRLKALGNGQVPQAAAAAWLMLTQKKPPHERAAMVVSSTGAIKLKLPGWGERRRTNDSAPFWWRQQNGQGGDMITHAMIDIREVTRRTGLGRKAISARMDPTCSRFDPRLPAADQAGAVRRVG